MFCTRQALEKQTQRWAWCPFRQVCCTRSSVCLLFDESVWICISIPKGQGLEPGRAESKRERGWGWAEARERGAVCVSVHMSGWGQAFGAGPCVCLHVHVCLRLCEAGGGQV